MFFLRVLYQWPILYLFGKLLFRNIFLKKISYLEHYCFEFNGYPNLIQTKNISNPGSSCIFFEFIHSCLEDCFLQAVQNITSLEKYYVYIICFRCPDENYAQSSITLYRYPRSMSAQNTHSGVGTIILIFNNKSMISVYLVKYKTRWTISMNDVERC